MSLSVLSVRSVVQFFLFFAAFCKNPWREAAKVRHMNAKANPLVALTVAGLKTLGLARLRTFLLISTQVIVDFLKQRTVSIRI
jgi:hypothetical protein